MCGIVGYIGNKKAIPILIDGLKKLEYRGYDSAGISVLENNKISIIKDKGRVNNLENLLVDTNSNATVGIAHTRWATHGKPSKINSHPHMDNSNTFSIVQNGIIENYKDIKKFLMDNGYKFLSETDTEVIPNLIAYYYKSNDLLHAVALACKDLNGSFAIEVLCKDYPDRIIVSKKDSPLVIGTTKTENYIASDIPAILSYSKDFYILNDNEIAEVFSDKLNFYNNNLEKISKKIENISWDASAIEKNGYEDFMLKEIHEQPSSIRETIGATLSNKNIEINNLSFSKDFLSNLNRIFIIACGTAMHAGLAVKQSFEKLCKIPVEVDVASEFRYRDPLVDSHTLSIFISQSGETADTIGALKLAKSKGATTLAISNVIGSSITREADFYIYTHAGPEIAVASTKAYVTQLIAMYTVALHFATLRGTQSNEKIESIKKEMLTLPEKVEKILSNKDEIQKFAAKHYGEKDMYFLGRGLDYGVAMEGSLKLKEITYIHSEAYAGGELKHGPIALIEKNVVVIGLLTQSELVDKMVSNIQEVVTRGARVLGVMCEKDKHYAKSLDASIIIPDTISLLTPV